MSEKFDSDSITSICVAVVLCVFAICTTIGSIVENMTRVEKNAKQTISSDK